MQLLELVDATKTNQILLDMIAKNVSVSSKPYEDGLIPFTFNIVMSKYDSTGPSELETELNQLHAQMNFSKNVIKEKSIEIYCK